MNTFVAMAILLWGTTALTAMGVGLQAAIGFAVPYNLASIAFTIGSSVMAARFGTRLMLVVLAVGTALALACGAALGLSGTPPVAAIGTVYVAAGGFIGGIQALLFVLAVNSYPLECRSTGVRQPHALIYGDYAAAQG